MSELFDKVKASLLTSLKITTAKQKTKDQFLVSIQEDLENMEPATKIWGLLLYLKWCRLYHQEIMSDK